MQNTKTIKTKWIICKDHQIDKASARLTEKGDGRI